MVRRSVAAASLTVALACSSALSSPARSQTSLTVFPIRLHVGRDEAGAPAVTDDWLTEQLTMTNELYGQHGVGFSVASRHPLPAASARLETRADRHALGSRLDRARVDVFVVFSLRDVDDPTRMRGGVHWRPAGRPGAHFVIVSAISSRWVLAHELGHYFGNPHSPTPGNIMSYDRGSVPPFFDAGQIRRITQHARRFARARAPAAIPGATASNVLPPESDLPR